MVHLASIWQKLTEPTDAIQQAEHRRQARLLAGMMIVLIPISIWAFFDELFRELDAAPDVATLLRENPFFAILIASTLTCVLVYALSRSKHYKWGACIIVATIYGASWLAGAGNLQPGGLLTFLILGILVGSLFFSLRGTVALYLVALLGTYLLRYLPVPAATNPVAILYAVQNILIIGSVIVVAAAIRRRDLEQIQQQARELAEATVLRAVVQNMPVMLTASGADLNAIVWNQECQRVTGYGEDEIVGNPRAVELLYPDKACRRNPLGAVTTE